MAKKDEEKKNSKSKVSDQELEAIVADSESKALVQKCRNLFHYAKEARRKYDWEWLVRTLYVRGYHFARYNRNTSTVTFGNRSGVRIPVNLLHAHLRGVRNQVTSFRPKWEVFPKVTTESALENARYSGKVLDYIYDQSHIKRAIKEVVTQSLLYSVGIWQFTVDKDGKINVRTVDPFDFYIDPNTRSADINDPEQGAEFIIRTMNMPLDAVVKNPNYTGVEELQPDNQVASADYKRFLLQVTRHIYQRQQEEAPTVIVKECQFRERQDDGTFKIRIVTYIDSLQTPIRNELTDKTEYDYEIYQGELTPLEVYGESWSKHLIPINRVIDSLESHIFEYNHLFARGRFVIDKNSGIRLIVNQHGQIIEKNRGSTVTSLPITPLPNAPFQQLINMRQHFEDISGVHDASLGRIPAGVKSGIGIAELKQADATNQSDLVDNLEDFLSRAGGRILKLVAEHWNTSKLINVTGEGGKPEYFMAVGERGKSKKKKDEFTFGEMKLPLATIGAENEVRVKVGSWLAYTKEARQEKLKELFRLGAIDQKALLEHMEFGDIDGIMERTRQERLLQGRAGAPSQSVQRMTGQEMSDEELALAENELMLEGKDQPVEPDDDHEVHISVHRELQDDRKQGHVIKAHINEHLSLARWQRGQESQPFSPEEQQAQGNGPERSPVAPTPDLAAMLAGGGGPGGPGPGGPPPGPGGP